MNKHIKQISILIAKEFLLEWRSKYAIGGIILYVLSTIFIVYNGFIRVSPQTWNPLFWIIVLFTSINAITKSFVRENGQRQLYYYTITNPVAVIFSKIIYNSVLLIGLNLLTYTIFGIVTGDPVKDKTLFFIAILLGSIGMAVTFTFISAIANKANNSATLMAILSFPVILPILISVIKISASAVLITDTSVNQDILTLLAIITILMALAYVLFPFLWKD